MKSFRIAGLASLILVLLAGAPSVSAATSPGIGAANSFNILSSSYVNTNAVPGTTISSDLGYTTPPAVAPTVGGVTHIADSTYNQAGIDQGNALSALNSQPCSFTFAPGPINLATDTTHGTAGSYAPGVYCISGAADIGSGGTITLTGAGTYIFRMDGALTSSANSKVVLAGGASACDVWWTPTQATTLGANSTFAGTDMDASGISIGDVVTWQGQALAFGGTVSTSNDTITSPVCTAARSTTPSAPTTTPGLPNTGMGPVSTNNTFLELLAAVLVTALGIYVVRKKRLSL